MSVRCQECNSEDVITECFVLVCSNCGNVVNDVPEPHEIVNQIYQKSNVQCDSKKVSCLNPHVQTVCRDYTSTVNAKISETVHLGIDLIRNVCQTLNIPKAICEMSINFFKEIVANREFKFEPSYIKQCLALSCLYVIVNQENYPMPLTELWKNTDCSFTHLGSVLFRMERLFPQCRSNSKSKLIESLLPFYLFQLKLDEKERPLIEEYSTSLVWMWRQALLVQGFNPIYIIYAALFYGWKAVNPNRAKVRPKEFFAQVNIECKQRISQRVHFFYKVLEKFVQCCPLYDKNTEVTIDTISLKIKDITTMKRIVVANFDQLKCEIRWPERKKRNLDNANNVECLKAEFNFLGFEDVELSDSEIDSYIRTDDEVKRIKHLQNEENVI